jgi:predicted membrane-bound mannosyltransferase
LILILALVGIAAAFGTWSRRPCSTSRGLKNGDFVFPVFLSFYTVISTAAYSLIPYKTPWNILPFYLGFILLAGSGAVALLRTFKNQTAQAAFCLLLAAGYAHLGAQARSAALVYPADPLNPYVYAQTSPGFLKLVRKVEDLAAVHPDREKMLIEVVAGPYETWPLPWYLRGYGRVGYWTGADEVPSPGDASVLITDAEQAGRLEPILDTSFQSEFYELRPNIFLVLHIRNDLWDAYVKSRAGAQAR